MGLLKSPARIITLLLGVIGAPVASSGQIVNNDQIRVGTIFSRDEATESRQRSMRVLTEYFNKINSEGGINGRPIEIFSYDDGGDSKKTLDLARRLVEQDHVACLFHLSARADEVVRPYVRFKKIPVLFYRPPAFRQAQILGSYVSRHLPDATVAVIRPGGPLGTEYLSGLHEGLGMERARAAITNVQAIESLNQGLNQVEPVSGTRAGLLVIFGPADLQLKLSRDLAKLEWKPRLVVSDAALSLDLHRFTASSDMISLSSTRDYVAAMNSAEWKAFSQTNLTREDFDSNAAAYGYVLAKSIVSILRNSSEMNRCELNVVRSNGNKWEVAESGMPCEQSQ